MNVFLIGYRCCGKTSVGQSVAEAINWPFVDADTLLVSECGKHIKDIVDAEGWETFRRMERSTLEQICKNSRQIVATGGGVVLDKANIKAMKTSGLVIWLKATAETIRQRMLPDKNTGNFRPALTDRGPIEEVEDMLLKRNPFYESACDISIPADDRPVNEIAGIIIHRIKDAIGE